eukprot:8842082-Lingulodinium_polyedra.AAC.1
MPPTQFATGSGNANWPRPSHDVDARANTFVEGQGRRRETPCAMGVALRVVCATRDASDDLW